MVRSFFSKVNTRRSEMIPCASNGLAKGSPSDEIKCLILHLPGLLEASSTSNVITLPQITLSLHIQRFGAPKTLQEQKKTNNKDEMLAILSASCILLRACTKRASSYRRQLLGPVLSALVTALCNYKQKYFSTEMTVVNRRNKQKAH